MLRHPEALYLLLLLVVLVPLLVSGFYRSLSTLKGFFGAWRGESLRETYLVKYFFAALGILLVFGGMAFALAGFHREKDLEISDFHGTDVVFAMDISRSMLCEDLEPNRLERAAAIARGVVEQTPDARFGVVVFKGKAVKTIPVTEDSGAINSFLAILDPNLLSAPGSNVEEALLTAAGAFPDLERRRKIVILFSDGESLTGNPSDAAAAMASREVTVITVGTGTEDGGVIPLGSGDVLMDESGRRVVTRLDRTMLEEIAGRTAGEYLAATHPGVINRIADIAGGGDKGTVFVSRETDIYRGFLLVALAGYVIFLLVRIRRWKNLE